jgi:UbiD family decarboxylase
MSGAPFFKEAPFQSLRKSLSYLDEKGELIHITRKVNPRFELAAVIKNVQDTANKAICFENVEGFHGTIASNLCGSYENIALALCSDMDSVANTWARGSAKTGRFDYGPSVQSTTNLKKFSLEELPGIVFHDKDAGPYITGGVVLAKHPETGRVNLSFHRVQMTGTEEFGIRLSPSGHLFACQQICEDQGRALECAILVGNSPLILLAAAATIPASQSELDLASHLLGRPWSLRKCPTIDLEVPEDTEIVIEGEILPNLRRTEGPFGEWMGYYAAPAPNHVFKIKAIFGQEQPIYYAVLAGSKEELMLTSVPIAGSILNAVRVFVPSVMDVACWPMPQFCVVKIRKKFEGEEHKALLAALGAELNRILFVVVVDEDVDIYDPTDVLWAMSTRCRPDKDIFIIPNVPSFARDPFQRHWGRVGIDATVPIDLAKDFERKKISVPGSVRWEDYI